MIFRKFLCGIWFLIFFFCWSNQAAAQEEHPRDAYLENTIETKDIDRDVLKSAVEGINYSEDQAPKELEIDDDSDDPYDQQNRYNNFETSGEGWSSLFKFLFVIIIIVAVALLIYFLVGENLKRPSNKKINSADELELSIENLEEKIHESDLERLIRQALGQENYSLATRIYYLAIIKELSIQKRIKWKKDKTNRDYIQELGQSDLATPFRQLTRIYERVWYGNGALNAAQFNQLRPGFEQLIARVKSSPIAAV